MKATYKAIYDNHYDAISYAECIMRVGYIRGYEISFHSTGYKISFR
ncbi:hypothetical protein [Dysgonomonas macrotermitis]|uniref:Uncharacterized protein n=1 Tax=Dysgonomonas macrotermitis TaxID=1346286 RepID=A0A1M5GKQ3_9BACT|nr:hypothetical protein [Dysgonomonas macrotermitis]SHG04335.1 hypothetical protein SAMN05444362_11449 [Dysgonomonas macrotermitis]